MKVLAFGTMLAGLWCGVGLVHLHAQGTFQNLDFEAANLPFVPSGSDGGLVSTTNGIPGWMAYYGQNQAQEILHNNMTLGEVNISILGPNWDYFPLIQGSYSVFLQAGLLNSTTRTPAAIAQTGTIPASARSLQFFARPSGLADPAQLVVTIGGQSIPLFQLATSSAYNVYGADISSFAGQVEEMRLASLPYSAQGTPYNYFLIDSFQFSNQRIPEPSTVGLLSLGALFLGWRLRRRRG